MGRTQRQKMSGFGKTGKKLTPKYGRMVHLYPGGPSVVQPTQLPKGWQRTTLKIPTRVVPCGEYGCKVFLEDRVDPGTGKLIKAGTKPCGMIHREWNGNEPMYQIHYAGEAQPRLVELNQYIDELCAGIDLALSIKKEGSYESSRKS